MGALSSILRSAAGGRLTWWCPGCGRAHQVAVFQGSGPLWGWNGDAERPTFTPSVLVTYNGPDAGQDRGDGITAPPAVCHSFVMDGQMQFLGDCTHALAGQTVQIPDFPGGGA